MVKLRCNNRGGVETSAAITVFPASRAENFFVSGRKKDGRVGLEKGG